MDQEIEPNENPDSVIDEPIVIPEQPVVEEQRIDELANRNPEIAEDSAFTATAIPDNTATDFIKVDGEDNVTGSVPRSDTDVDQAETWANKANDASLFIKLVNEGNLCEMKIKRQMYLNSGKQSLQKIASFVDIIINASEDPEFHALRAQILQPLAKTKSQEEIQDLIDQSKYIILRQSGVPQGVSSEDISWDAFSFKTPPVGIEFFCQRVPYMVQKLKTKDMITMYRIEAVIEDAIKSKCAEYRARTNTFQDEFIEDYTVYLENQIAGAYDDDRSGRIEGIGRNTLILYVQRMQQLFLTGNLPASIQPAKIYDCHDIATAAELRASIQKMGEKQISQAPQLVQSKHVLAALDQGSSGDQNWTDVQAATIMMRRNNDTFGRKISRTLGVDYDRPMKQLEHQLAGSANTMTQQMEVAKGDYALHMNEEQKEISRQQLSIMLACLRMRANAIMGSEWELMTDDDLDHLEIVKLLSRQLPEIGNGADEVFKLAYQIQLSYSRGHNMQKLAGRDLPADLYEHVSYTIKGRVKNLLRQVPLFDADVKSGGQLANMVIQCIIMSLAQKNRINQEYKERLQRKLISKG